MYEIKGIVEVVFDEKQVTEKFKKREIVIRVPSQNGNTEWDDMITLVFQQADVALVNGIKEGDEVTVKFFINGRKWDKNGEVRYFNSLKATGIEVITASGKTIDISSTQERPPYTAEEEDDDLPF